MLRYIAGVCLADRVPGLEVARRCEVRPVVLVIQENRMSWFGQFKRRRDEVSLREVMDMQVPG